MTDPLFVEVMIIAGDSEKNQYLLRNLEDQYFLYSPTSHEEAEEKVTRIHREEAEKLYVALPEKFTDSFEEGK